MKKTLCIICLVVLFGLTIGYGVSYHRLEEKKAVEQTSEEAYPVDSPVFASYKKLNAGEKDAYFVILEGDRVLIYCKDRKTLFMDTKIQKSELHDSDIERLIQGFYVNTIWEAYHLLESYTS